MEDLEEFMEIIMSDYEQWFANLTDTERKWLGPFLQHDEDADAAVIEEYSVGLESLLEMVAEKFPESLGQDFEVVEQLDEKISRYALCLGYPGIVSFFLIAGKKDEKFALQFSDKP